MIKKHSGFTLIELLVVIAIIGLLASIVLVSLNNTRAKARDTRRKADLAQISKALMIYYNNHNAMPINRNPCCGYSQDQPNFLQELIDDGILAKAPKDPGSGAYSYYDYGGGHSLGALVVANLETSANTTAGDPPSCRPWASGQNWCDQDSDKEYCVCNPY